MCNLGESGVSCHSFTFESHCVIGKCNENKRDVKFDSPFNEDLMQARNISTLLSTVE